MADNEKIFSDWRISWILDRLEEVERYAIDTNKRLDDDFEDNLRNGNPHAGTVGMAQGAFAGIEIDMKVLREMIYREFSNPEDRVERPTRLVGPSD